MREETIPPPTISPFRQWGGPLFLGLVSAHIFVLAVALSVWLLHSPLFHKPLARIERQRLVVQNVRSEMIGRMNQVHSLEAARPSVRTATRRERLKRQIDSLKSALFQQRDRLKQETATLESLMSFSDLAPVQRWAAAKVPLEAAWQKSLNPWLLGRGSLPQAAIVEAFGRLSRLEDSLSRELRQLPLGQLQKNYGLKQLAAVPPLAFGIGSGYALLFLLLLLRHSRHIVGMFQKMLQRSRGGGRLLSPTDRFWLRDAEDLARRLDQIWQKNRQTGLSFQQFFIERMYEEHILRSRRAQVAIVLSCRLDRLVSSIGLISEEIHSVSSQMTRHAQTFEQSSRAIIKNNAAFSRTIDNIVDQADEMNQVIGEQKSFTQTLHTHSEDMGRRLEDLEATLSEMDRITQGVSSVVRTIEEVAEYAEVLSLNASIEAARAAGGRGAAAGFHTVAAQVQDLSHQVRGAMGHIDHEIQHIQTIHENMYGAFRNVEDLFATITRSEHLKTLHQKEIAVVQNLNKAVEDLKNNQQRVTSFTQTVADSAKEAAKLSERTRKFSSAIDDTLEQLYGVTQEAIEASMGQTEKPDKPLGLTDIPLQIEMAAQQPVYLVASCLSLSAAYFEKTDLTDNLFSHHAYIRLHIGEAIKVAGTVFDLQTQWIVALESVDINTLSRLKNLMDNGNSFAKNQRIEPFSLPLSPPVLPNMQSIIAILKPSAAPVADFLDGLPIDHAALEEHRSIHEGAQEEVSRPPEAAEDAALSWRALLTSPVEKSA